MFSPGSFGTATKKEKDCIQHLRNYAATPRVKKLVIKNTKAMTIAYSPKISKEAYSKGLTLSFLKKQVQSFGDIAMASFVETLDELPTDKREYF